MQHTYRFIPIAIVFGVVILLTLILLWLGARMKYPKTTSFVVALYWTSVALLMFLGVGEAEEAAGGCCASTSGFGRAKLFAALPFLPFSMVRPHSMQTYLGMLCHEFGVWMGNTPRA